MGGRRLSEPQNVCVLCKSPLDINDTHMEIKYVGSDELYPAHFICYSRWWNQIIRNINQQQELEEHSKLIFY